MSADLDQNRLSAIPKRLFGALACLLEAQASAARAGRGTWDFAEEIEGLRSCGSLGSDLRWLVCQGYCEHRVETTKPSDSGRHFRPSPALSFSPRSCFVLTEAGVTLARQIRDLNPEELLSACPAGEDGDHAVTPQRPSWDKNCRRLWLGGMLVKEFRLSAPNQELILSAFEELGWPPHLDDPLPPRADVDPRKRLHDTITRLNRHHRQRVIQFHGNGSGDGIRWERSHQCSTRAAPERR
jgi:hypothetical protein